MTLNQLKTFPERDRLVRTQNHWIDERANLFANGEASCVLVSSDCVQFFCTMVMEDTTWVKIPLADFTKCDSREKVITYWEKKKQTRNKKQRSIATELLGDLCDAMREHYEGSKP